MIYHSFEDLSHSYFQWADFNSSSNPQPTLSDFNKVIPLVWRGPTVLQVVKISCLSDPLEVYYDLIRELFVGRYLKAFHVFLMFEIIWRQRKLSNQTAALMIPLFVDRAKARPIRIDSDYLSTHARLKDFLDPRVLHEITERFFSFFPKVPKKDHKISRHFTLKTDFIIQKDVKPRESARIGVGYKDKGNLRGTIAETAIGIEDDSTMDKFDWGTCLNLCIRLFPEIGNFLKENIRERSSSPICVASTSRPDDGSVVGTETQSMNPKLKQYVGISLLDTQLLLQGFRST